MNFNSHQCCRPDEGLRLPAENDKVDLGNNTSGKLNDHTKKKKKSKTTHLTFLKKEKVGSVTLANVPVKIYMTAMNKCLSGFQESGHL